MMLVGRLRSRGSVTLTATTLQERRESHYDSTLCVNVVDDVLRLAGFIVCVCVSCCVCLSCCCCVIAIESSSRIELTNSIQLKELKGKQLEHTHPPTESALSSSSPLTTVSVVIIIIMIIHLFILKSERDYEPSLPSFCFPRIFLLYSSSLSVHRTAQIGNQSRQREKKKCVFIFFYYFFVSSSS